MSTAVLISGGLDSAVLLAEEATRGHVQPIYISVGLAWEAGRACGARALSRTALSGRRWRRSPRSTSTCGRLLAHPLGHSGTSTGYHTPDEDVYLHGRNIVLLGKAGVYCATHRIGRIVLGTLDHNPFPDATPTFRSAMASALSLGLAHALTDRRAIRATSAKPRYPSRRSPRCPVRADTVLHEPVARKSALRRLQQMPRAARCIRHRGHRRSDRYSSREFTT
jgi:hypothetical protein